VQGRIEQTNRYRQPVIALSSPIKSARCIGNSSSAPRGGLSRCRQGSWRACAGCDPERRTCARSAQSNSFGPKGLRLNRVARMSAFARYPILRNGSAQLSNFCNSSSSDDASSVFSFPLMTRPVVPSSEIQSPSLNTWPFAASLRPAHRPEYRPLPPRSTFPCARDYGSVAGHPAPRRQNTGSDFHALNIFRSGFGTDENHRILVRAMTRFLTASSAVKTICPTAAPGEAATRRQHFHLGALLI